MNKITITIENDNDMLPIINTVQESQVTTNVEMDMETVREEEFTEITPEMKERFEAASDLANVCEYLEEPDLIKLKLIIKKCNDKRKKDEE